MSIDVMTMVWKKYPNGGSALLALLALADWSDDEGLSFPSMSAISKKTRLSRSQAQRVVHGLIEENFVAVLENSMGGAPGSTPRYQINLDKLRGRMDATPTGSVDATGSVGATGSADAADGPHGCGETGRTGATQYVNEPSLTVKGARKGAITLRAFLDACKATGEKTIDDTDPIFAYAQKVGIDLEMIEDCWNVFKAAHLQTAKKQKDWRAHFRNAVRLNWYRLWFLRDGEDARRTTAGEQA